MSDEIPTDIVALYRAGATEEPGTMLDEAILEAAHRRSWTRPAAIAALVVVTVLAVGLSTHRQPPSAPVPSAAQLTAPPGLEEGRGRLVAMSLSPATKRPGMGLQPAYDGGL
jgi:hypothetical protein